MKSTLPFIIAAALGIALFLAAPFILPVFQNDKPLPVYSQVTEFSMTDSESKPLTHNDLKGKIWVADFIFTSCGGQCPRMTQELHKVYRSYDLENDVRFVSISVDPERDTTEALKDYAKKYNIDTRRWHLLRAPLDEVKALSVNGFKVGSAEDELLHSERFVLVDKDLNVRGYYDSTDKDHIKQLFKDISRLQREKPRQVSSR